MAMRHQKHSKQINFDLIRLRGFSSNSSSVTFLFRNNWEVLPLIHSLRREVFAYQKIGKLNIFWVRRKKFNIKVSAAIVKVFFFPFRWRIYGIYLLLTHPTSDTSSWTQANRLCLIYLEGLSVEYGVRLNGGSFGEQGERINHKTSRLVNWWHLIFIQSFQ